MAPKSFLVFLLQAAFLLALIGFAPYAAEVYPVVVAAEGNGLLGGAGRRTVRFHWLEDVERADGADLRMTGHVAGHEEHVWRAVFSMRRRGYWPMAALLALLLATPMPARRRAWVLPAGVLLQNGFVLAHLTVLSLVFFAAVEGEKGRAVDIARASFNSPIIPYTVVFVIWALLARPARSIDLRSVNQWLHGVLGRAPD